MSRMSASCEGGFSLLALSQPALLEVFASLTEMRDSIALSLASKELWELGAASRRRALCCAACHHAVVPDAAAAFSSDTYREAPHLGLPDGDSHAFDAEHVALGCTLTEADHPLGGGFYPTLLSLQARCWAGEGGHLPCSSPLCICIHVCIQGALEGRHPTPRSDSGDLHHALEPPPRFPFLQAELRIRGAGGPGHEVRVQHVQCGGCGLHLGVRLVQLGSLRAGAAAACIRCGHRPPASQPS